MEYATIFGKNEIVGQKYFADHPDQLLVTSRFLTLQGEGPFRGHPALFLRLAKCNLDCAFCDTYFDKGDWYTFEQIKQQLDDCVGLKPYPELLVITGGEPMLQKNVVDFIDEYDNDFTDIQIESNGLIYQDLPNWVTLVVSPKCSEKTGKYLHPNEKVLEMADCLKFVVSADPKSPYHKIPDWAFQWQKDRRSNHSYRTMQLGENPGTDIFISPMNMYNKEPQKAKLLHQQKDQITIDERSQVDEVISFWEPGLLDMKANQKNHEYCGQYCVDNGLIFNLQMHLYASLA